MNSDIQSLLEKARDSLAAAKILLDEEYYGFAASRAYYSMFYVVEALMASLGKSYSSHSALQSAFGAEFAKTGKLDPKYHRWLIDSQDLRNTGDYGIGATLSRLQIEEMCSWAEEFIRVADKYLRS